MPLPPIWGWAATSKALRSCTWICGSSRFALPNINNQVHIGVAPCFMI